MAMFPISYEWQLASSLRNAIRYKLDRQGKICQFILIGSTVPPETRGMSLKELFSESYVVDGESRSDIDDLTF